MIAVDASALLAIFFGESEAGEFSNRILTNRQSIVSAGSALEGYIVVSGRTHDRVSDFLQMVNDLDLRTVPFDEHQLSLARDAFDRYGKGRHPAKLNFGDCMSYALAKAEGLPLLFKGDDFAKTDIETA